MDPDIPMAHATVISTGHTPPSSPTKRDETSLLKGRSSRVMVPKNPSTKQLSSYEIQTLQAQGYTHGLIDSVARSGMTFPLRIWVVDNSGSMSINDGHRIVESANRKDVKYVNCSRWAEIKETVKYHARMAALLEAPTVFRLLNDPGKMCGPQQFSVAERGPQHISEDLNIALSTINNVTPSGVTPLAEHVREIRENVLAMQEELRDNGQKVVIVLATDGLPSDPTGVCSQATRTEFEIAMRSLEGLPVWIVVRLCTDEENVVEFYNNLDSQLELSLEVLDDFVGEADEVYEHNKWLNYALPLHRVREMGFSHRLFDLLDERPLTKDDLREFCFLIFGRDRFDGVPDPQVDWKGFCDHTAVIVSNEQKQWNPMRKKMMPWIDMKKLAKTYGNSSCTIM
jgi:Mg-chelatase subunit ChlD